MESWLKSLSPSLQATWQFLSDEQRAAVFNEYKAIVAERFSNPRKFALMAFREHNPNEYLPATDRGLVVGAGVKLLKALEAEGTE